MSDGWQPEGSAAWRPIETAPKDGTWVLVTDANKHTPRLVLYVRGRGWQDPYDNTYKKPTHWMPPPSPALPASGPGGVAAGSCPHVDRKPPTDGTAGVPHPQVPRRPRRTGRGRGVMWRAFLKTLGVLCLIYCSFVGLFSAIQVYLVGDEFSMVCALQGGAGLMGLTVVAVFMCLMVGTLCLD